MKQVSKNFISLFISDAASRILGFIAIVYIARLLSVEGFGLVSYGLAFLTYALLFANPGLTTIGAREIAKDIKNRRIIDEILGLRLTLASLIFVLFIVGLSVIPGQLFTKRIILFYLLSLFPFAILLEFVFQGRQEMECIGISRFIQYGIYVILLFILLKKTQDILMVPVSFFAGYSIAAGFLIVVFLYKYKSIRIKFSFNLWRDLLITSTPVGLATIFNQVSLNLPPIILGVLYTKAEVGYFSAGFRIVAMLLIIERVFHYVFFPIISKQFKHAQDKLKSSFTFLTRLLFAITIPLACGGIVLADGLIDFIFGAEFEGAILIFRILLLYFLFAPVNTIFGYGLVAINQQKRFLKVITITAIINTILIIILGIHFKGQGAAAALFVSEMIGIILMHRELIRFIEFNSLKYIVKPLISAILMGIVLYTLRQWHVIILVILGIFIYTILFYLIKGFSKEELRNLKLTFTQK